MAFLSAGLKKSELDQHSATCVKNCGETFGTVPKKTK